MLVFGTKSDTVRLSQVEPRHCQTCERERPFSLVLHYTYEHLWFIFAYVSKKQYMLLCDYCSQGQELEADQVEEQLGRVPIPFMHRFGCVVLLFLIGLMTLYFVLFE